MGEEFVVHSTLNGKQAFLKALSAVNAKHLRSKAGLSIYFREVSEFRWELVGGKSHAECRKLADMQYIRSAENIDVSFCSGEQDSFAVSVAEQAEKLFLMYLRCVDTKQVERPVLLYLDSLLATKININGRIYLIPPPYTAGIPAFEQFMTVINQKRISETYLEFNSIPLPDDSTQREKLSASFVLSFQDKARECIQSARYLLDSQSPSRLIKLRWYHKIDDLMNRLHFYEALLDTDFQSLEVATELCKTQAELIVNSLLRPA